MKTPSQYTPGPGPNRRPVGIPSPLEINVGHLSCLLSIINGLTPYLIKHSGAVEGIEIDREAADSASTLFIKTCDRIEKIVEKDSRWDQNQFDALSESLQTLYESNTEAMNEQKQSVQMMRLPHVLLKPELKQDERGLWVATYGQLTGIGTTPIEAMNNFDLSYIGFMQPGAEDLPPAAPESPQDTEAPKRRRKKQ